MEINKIVEKMFEIRVIIDFTHYQTDRKTPPLNANTKCNTDPP
jgi:hypothetical protein